jgi:hypothetical protein
MRECEVRRVRLVSDTAYATPAFVKGKLCQSCTNLALGEAARGFERCGQMRRQR